MFVSGSSNTWRTFGVFCGDLREGLNASREACEGLTEVCGRF